MFGHGVCPLCEVGKLPIICAVQNTYSDFTRSFRVPQPKSVKENFTIKTAGCKSDWLFVNLVQLGPDTMGM